MRLALLGSHEHVKGEARHHVYLKRSAVGPLTPAVLEGAELTADAISEQRPLAMLPTGRATLLDVDAITSIQDHAAAVDHAQ